MVKEKSDEYENTPGTHVTKDGIKYENIERTHISKSGKEKPVKVRYFPDLQITTISRTTEDPETKELKDEIVKEGMSREEIEKYFPPDKSHPDKSFDLKHLISSILYESYMKEGVKGLLEPGNRQHFWYSHLKPILLGTMGCLNNLTLGSTITQAWTALVETDLISYEEMNVYSAKETGRLSNVKDSPYYTLIVGVEKQSYFKGMTRLPMLFYCTLVTGGGQPSTGVLRRFFRELKELDVDLNQLFHICTASDFDPAGFDIEGTFAHKIIGAIKYNGGAGNVAIHRLFVRREQITDTLLKSQGMPYTIKKAKPKAIKQAETLWRKFVDKTGGLYIPKPEGWKTSLSGIEITKPEVDGKGKENMLRAILEMDAFSSTIIENVVGRELLKIIRDNDLDETKIMAPEIMRVFEGKKEEVAEELYGDPDDEDADTYYNEMIKPLRDDFEDDISDWEDEIRKQKTDSKKTINDAFELALTEKEEEKEERVPDLYDEKNDYELEKDSIERERDKRIDISEGNYNRLIEELEEQRDAKTSDIENEYSDIIEDIDASCNNIDDKIAVECEDIDREIAELEEFRDKDLGDVNTDYAFRMEKYNKFKEEHLATFNPIEEELREDIKNKIEEFDYRYRVLESRAETREKLSDCYDNRRLLLEKNISVFMHPTPAFKGKPDLLEQAFNNKDLNIGRVRDSLPVKLLEGMKELIKNDMKDVTFELGKTLGMPDLAKDVEKAKAEIEKELSEMNDE